MSGLMLTLYFRIPLFSTVATSGLYRHCTSESRCFRVTAVQSKGLGLRPLDIYSRVRILLRAWMVVSRVCCVRSRHFDGQITRPDESYRARLCVYVCVGGSCVVCVGGGCGWCVWVWVGGVWCVCICVGGWCGVCVCVCV
jgi:hypothetical protein